MPRALASIVLLAGCALRDPPAPQRAAPLPADPPIELAAMDVECDAFVAALTAYRDCAHHEPHERAHVEGLIDYATRGFVAGKKTKLDDDSQKAIANACRRAKNSVSAAHERCKLGPRPKFGAVAP